MRDHLRPAPTRRGLLGGSLGFGLGFGLGLALPAAAMPLSPRLSAARAWPPPGPGPALRFGVRPPEPAGRRGAAG
jgi:hypothetical protein